MSDHDMTPQAARPPFFARWRPITFQHRFGFAAALAIAFVAIVYLPACRAGFVWIDRLCFQDYPWLREGNEWKQYIFHGFYDWVNYFRPLVVALFTAEVRLFDSAPMPMHTISLLLHLANTLFVGLLGKRLLDANASSGKAVWLSLTAMLVYGLHPASIEPVVWVSCQFELVVTFFCLLGLLANTAIRRALPRAAAVSACFFLAACAKEQAAPFPLLLVLFDWLRLPLDRNGDSFCARLRALLREQLGVYLAVFAAGCAYLLLRRWALGFTVAGMETESFFTLAHLQTVCFVYMTYWRTILWPMAGISPFHLIPSETFATLDAASIGIDATTIALPIFGAALAIRRKAFGILILAVTAALLPVLHLVPVVFDASLYHERYAMLAIAAAAALLPRIIGAVTIAPARRSAAMTAATLVAVAWLGLAVANIRVTLPLWSSDVTLWQWTLQSNPDSEDVKSKLLTAYMNQGDRPQMRALLAEFDIDHMKCLSCLPNIALTAIQLGDLTKADAALSAYKTKSPGLLPHREFESFMLATGMLLVARHDLTGAIETFDDTLKFEPQSARAYFLLASSLAEDGQTARAREVFDKGMPLFSPSLREAWRRSFEQALARGKAKTEAATPPPE